jgi:succinate-semialdehyde dehydrogenase/glutarate-semialdehyde dehydrogenase
MIGAVMDLKREACLVGGRWITNSDWIEVDNPATGKIIGRVPRLGPAETTQAIEAAQAAMPAWAARTGKDRSAVLRRFFDLMQVHREALAAILTEEQGKPLAEARGEIDYAASFIEWFAEEAKRVYGDVIPGHAPDKRILVLKQPIGVVAAITPWNFPAAMITRKIGPALAAGCAVVVKPANQTPFTALALGVLAEEAGLPAGLLNVITGNAVEIGKVLTDSPVVRKLSFTGSTAVGAKLYAQSAATIKKLSLELGGNAPFIVFDDADLDAAVAGAMQAKFRNGGQTCVSPNRFYVQDGIHDAFVTKLAAAAAALKVGPGASEGTQIGPMIDDRAVSKVESHLADAIKNGAVVATGGARHELGGTYFQPTVISGVSKAMVLTCEETFGPLAPVTRFKDESEAIALANDTEFGLAAYFFTRDLARSWRVGEALEAGIVGLNTGLISTEVAPFGGVKMSGLGREGSRHGIEDYVEMKYLCIGL